MVLLQKRVSWMMQRWLRDLQGSQMELEQILHRAIAQIQPNLTLEMPLGANEAGDLPSLKHWCSEWADTLVQECDRVLDVLHLANIRFPIVTWDASHVHYQEWCDLHDETDIETWLTLLVAEVA